ncbi:aminopeptidase [Actinomadura sp. NBRC 104425]|uniref:M28 family peptidase n=1 Tax=Actinomadura sp. NBRC 104425 TaxID=3032204 RepID=UPI0024A1C85B|nr:M28 family peptidase [Actinomadura sp. NBRC 104425]GLZ13164.1 aminopeptidase [Actinomadura sp. NBRC 104425]
MRKLAASGAVGGTVALAVAATGLSGRAAAEPADRGGPADVVTIGDVRRHLAEFQRIAERSGGNRAAQTPGEERSVAYVVGRLRRAGYAPQVQRFGYVLFEETRAAEFAQVEPVRAEFTADGDFQTMLYSGAGDVTARAVAVDVPPEGATGTSGCEPGDFQGFPRGAIALLQRGTCRFTDKAANAQAAGASAVVIFDVSGTKKALAGSLGRPFTLPVLGVSHAVGVRLVKAAADGRLRLRVAAHTVNTQRRSVNVVADAPGGDERRVVVVGAHLDSVRKGPGINDNATGAAAVLAVAERFGALPAGARRNRVRFAWWGAEEDGLRGSDHYVRTLPAADRARIGAVLNFDMLGSPNGVRGVYDGDASGGTPVEEFAPPPGSARIERLFRDYFAARRLPTAEQAFDGRSDYGPFVVRGIPAGGMATGAEQVKTAAEAATFGGTAGKPYDPCYHAACDTVANVDMRLLDTNVDGAAHVTQRLAAGPLPVKRASRRTVSGRAADSVTWGPDGGLRWTR